MPLADYRRKRRFDTTPEPSGGAGEAAGGRFVVQEHHARRLHYDFRLEIGGALKSWAVPKGPSLNPKDKRLAVRTEDHPLEYAGFEGEIPKGNYGAGRVIVWDQGSYIAEGGRSLEEQLERGELKFALKGTKLRGSFALVRLKPRGTKSEEWLLIKHRDSYAEPSWDIAARGGSVLDMERLTASSLEGAVAAGMPSRVEVMLASATAQAFTDPEWLFELKWDGMRVIAFVQAGALRLFSRSGREVTSGFPELHLLSERLLARDAVLDGEIVVLDEEGHSSFERMQSRMNVARPPAALLRSNPVDCYFFDILYCDGFDLRSVPLSERKRFLGEVLDPLPPIRYSDHVPERGEDFFRLASERGAEGIVAKRLQSPYVPGRSTDWLKVKAVRELDAVIGGFTAPRGGRAHLGALLLGLYEGKSLRFIGGVGTGFTAHTQQDVMKALTPLVTPTCPFDETPNTAEPATWVRPELAARVKYGEITRQGRLRAPVFLTLRHDIEPAECTLAAEQAQAATPAAVTIVSSGPVLSAPEEIERELLEGRAENATLEIAGRRVRLSNLNKIYFPDYQLTKRNLLAWYYRVADYILPFLRERPLVLHRFPNGVGGQPFYQKDAGLEKADWMPVVPIPSEGRNKEITYYLVDDVASLLFLTNLGCIEHNPWSSRISSLDHPDYVFFDLDPVEGTPFGTVVEVAREIVKILKTIGCRPFVKTSGATGMHIFVPLDPAYTYEHVRTFAEIVARLVHSRLPEATTLDRSPGKRPGGTVYLDYSQNARGRPLASVYSVRPRAEATISAPVAPSELRRTLVPARFTLRSMPSRMTRHGDLWGGFWDNSQQLEPALDRLMSDARRL